MTRRRDRDIGSNAPFRDCGAPSPAPGPRDARSRRRGVVRRTLRRAVDLGPSLVPVPMQASLARSVRELRARRVDARRGCPLDGRGSSGARPFMERRLKDGRTGARPIVHGGAGLWPPAGHRPRDRDVVAAPQRQRLLRPLPPPRPSARSGRIGASPSHRDIRRTPRPLASGHPAASPAGPRPELSVRRMISEL